VVGEATLISALGGALGFVGAHGVVWAGGAWIEHSAGFRPSAGFLSEELLAYVLVVVAGAVGGLLPAFKAYRNDAAAHLAPVA